MKTETDLDAKEIAAHITMTITHVGEVAWRTRIAGWLIALARAIAPFLIELEQRVGEPQMFFCPHCGRGFCGFFVRGMEYMTVFCPYCRKQSWVVIENGEPKIVKEPPPCDWECGYAEPYGFVLEDGCPVHD